MDCLGSEAPPAHEEHDLENTGLPTPSKMHVDFALFKEEKLLLRGSFLVTKDKGLSCHGEQVQITALRATGESTAAYAFSGLIIEHEFELPAANLTLRYFEVEPATTPDQSHSQVQRFSAALQMGIHHSEEWETIALGGFDLAFRCDPL